MSTPIHSAAAKAKWNFIAELPKGLFLASILLLAWLVIFAMVVRWNALPNMAELLPGEETEAFWILDKADLKDSGIQLPAEQSTFMGTPLTELNWINRFGEAWVDGRDLAFVEVNSKSDAEDFLDSLKAPDETYKETAVGPSVWSTIYCYSQSQPYCFTWVGNLLFVGGEEDLLLAIQETAIGVRSSLESESKYQNVRGRLAHWNSGFYYIDLQASSSRFLDEFGAASALLELFPSMGGALSYQALDGEKAYLSESFLGVDKTLLGGEAFYHSEAPYPQKILPWTSEGLAWEWGGQNLYAEWERMGEILNSISPASGVVWEAQTNTTLSEWFGEDFDFKTELAPLLNEEQYFGFTPGGDFLFIAELETGEAKQVDALKDRLGNNLEFAVTSTNEKGETVAELLKPTVELVKRNETLTYEFKVNDEVKLSVVILNNAVILSNSSELALSTLDRALGHTESRNLQELEGLLAGSDEVLILHCPLLPDGNILKTLGGGFESILSTRKLFDDGVFTRTLLHEVQL